MSRPALAILTLLLATTVGVAQQYRNPIYITGGQSNPPPTNMAPGLWLVDGNRHTTTSLVPPTLLHCPFQSVTMDVDNRSLVFVGMPSTAPSPPPFTNCLCRFDPATGVVTTITTGNSAGPIPSYIMDGASLDQDGDFVFTAHAITRTYPTTIYKALVLKHRAGGSTTTLFDTDRDIGEWATLSGAMGRDIANGLLLVQARYRSTRYNWFYGVLDIDPHQTGKWSTFSNGGGAGGYGWYQPRGSIQQDYATDALMTERGGHVWRLDRGTTRYSTIVTYNWPYHWHYAIDAQGVVDLQSSASRRVVAPMRYWNGSAMTAAFVAIDLNTQGVTTFACDPTNQVGVTSGPTDGRILFEPYRGRHIASVQSGSLSKWTLRFSVPDHPSKTYVAVAGISGVRPPIKLLDGRRIWIYPDGVTVASAAGLLKPFFDGGPLRLDSSGEARGQLDLSAFPKLGGRPVWIALVVLDPQAPSGVAFIPDTYVIRVP